jgi:uncharacterized protein YeeX (DUF496 family)
MNFQEKQKEVETQVQRAISTTIGDLVIKNIQLTIENQSMSETIKSLLENKNV